jgi:site-specific recombinase XerD
MQALTLYSAGPIATRVPAQADSDAALIALWLHGRSIHTVRAYDSAARRFLAFSGVALNQARLSDVQGFADTMDGLADASRAQALAAIKSLFTFAHKLGYVPFNVAAAIQLPKVKNTLAERILPESDVQRMFVLEPSQRNRAILRLLYGAGLRVSELCGLIWLDLQPREDQGGQVTMFGKGGRTRVVRLPAVLWTELVALRAGAPGDAPVFRSRKGGSLDASMIRRIVTAAAGRAGIDARVSPHWMRHAHASHSLDRGAPIHLVQSTLGHASVATTGRYLHARPADSSARYLAL